MSLPDTMTVMEVSGPGGPEVLVAATRAVPSPGHGEILVRASAVGVNRPDVLQRMGAYPPPPDASDLLGLEVAGEVAAVGAGVSAFQAGDRVCGLTPGGAYAAYCCLPADHALPIPAGFDDVMAAALPETCFTVWTNVFDRGGLRAGETFLVQGGASGIGTTAIQLARQAGARVFATAGSGEKCRACEALGAERAINYKTEDFVEAIAAATDGRGVDLILDMVGGKYFQKHIEALAEDGRLVQIAFLAGRVAEVDFLPVMRKRLTITGSNLRPQSNARKAAIAAALRESVWPWLETGRVHPVIDSTFALTEAAQAHERMESGAHIGKIVLTV